MAKQNLLDAFEIKEVKPTIKMIKDYDNWILRHFVVEKALGQEGTKALRKAIRHKGNRVIRKLKGLRLEWLNGRRALRQNCTKIVTALRLSQRNMFVRSTTRALGNILKSQCRQKSNGTNFLTNLVPYYPSALVPAEPVLHFRWLRSIGATHVKRWVEGRRAVAFTMAEILLSLTIIGVVAAITLPSLTGNINEKT